MRSGSEAATRRFVIIAVIVLVILHQDCWWWNDARLVFGFLPIGLAYHALYSVLAAVVWALAVKFAWPSEVEAMAEGNDEVAA